MLEAYFSRRRGLLANALVEILGSIVLLLKSDWVFGDLVATIMGATVVRLYAIAILIVGIFSFQVYRHGTEEGELVRKSLLAVITFHFLISLTLWGAYQGHAFGLWEAILTHGILVVYLGLNYFFVQKNNLINN